MTASTPSGGLSGRSDLLAAALETVERCAGGTGALVRIRGEAGIGKSTFAAALSERAHELGFAFASTTCTALEQTTPLAPFGRAVDGAGVSIFDVSSPAPASLAIGVARGSTQGHRYAAIEALVEQTQSFCRTPALLVVEDLQWADPATLEALGQLAELTATEPLVLVVTLRPSLHGSAYRRFDRAIDALGAQSLDLKPLSREEVAEFVRERTGEMPSDALIEWVRGAGGNPFLVHEFVDGLLAEGRLVVRDARLHSDGSDVPKRLRQAIGAELADAGDDVTALVRAASIIGQRAPAEQVAALLGASPLTLARAWEQAARLGLMDEDGEAWCFRHDLVRDAVYQDMPEAVRRASHRKMANILADRDAQRSIVAAHLLLAGGDDPETLTRLHEAAEQTAPLSPDSAIEFLDRARDLVSDLATRIVIEQARLETLTFLGRLDEAESIAHWLLEVAPPDEHSVLWGRLAGIATIAGEGVRAMSYLERARELEDDDYERCPMIALSALTSVTNGDIVGAITFAEEAIRLGEATGHPVGPSVGQGLLGRIFTFAFNLDAAVEMGARAVAAADADACGDAHWYLPCLHYGMTAFDLDRMEVADDMRDRGRTVARELPLYWSEPYYGAFAAALHLRRGEVEAAAAESEAAVAAAHRLTSLQALSWANSLAALAVVEIGEVEEAERWLAAAQAAWDAGHTALGADVYGLAKARVLRAAGDAEGAFEALTHEWIRLEQSFFGFCHPVIARDLAELAHARHDAEWFARVRDGLDDAAERTSVPSTQAKAMWVRAIGAGDAVLARAALERLDATQHRFEAATWMAHGAELLGGSDAGTIAILREARDRFSRMGAHRSEVAVRNRLSALGEPQQGDSDAWGSLTPTEREILRLLADGLTNAEIAHARNSSRRTVESHLGRVYRKLAIDSRVRLTIAASDYFRR